MPDILLTTIMLNDINGITITISEVKIMPTATSVLCQPLFSTRLIYTGLKMVKSTMAPKIELNSPLNANIRKQPSITIPASMMLLRCL